MTPDEADAAEPSTIVRRRAELFMQIADLRQTYLTVFEEDAKALKEENEMLHQYWLAKVMRR